MPKVQELLYFFRSLKLQPPNSCLDNFDENRPTFQSFHRLIYRITFSLPIWLNCLKLTDQTWQTSVFASLPMNAVPHTLALGAHPMRCEGQREEEHSGTSAQTAWRIRQLSFDPPLTTCRSVKIYFCWIGFLYDLRSECKMIITVSERLITALRRLKQWLKTTNFWIHFEEKQAITIILYNYWSGII